MIYGFHIKGNVYEHIIYIYIYIYIYVYMKMFESMVTLCYKDKVKGKSILYIYYFIYIYIYICLYENV